MALRGSRELRRRLKAIRTVFKPVGRTWARETVRLASSRVRVETGKTKRSIRVKNASQRKASVEARYGARFLEAGAQAHTLRAKKFDAMKFNVGGRPVFAKRVKHPGSPKQPFLRPSAADALDDADMLQELLKLWNQAA
jgi:hypothetical protein